MICYSRSRVVDTSGECIGVDDIKRTDEVSRMRQIGEGIKCITLDELRQQENDTHHTCKLDVISSAMPRELNECLQNQNTSSLLIIGDGVDRITEIDDNFLEDCSLEQLDISKLTGITPRWRQIPFSAQRIEAIPERLRQIVQ
eukprot:TRINITY_DN2810_c4_g1_i1.p1 TRINITY_DN2810_c4_g1~~TRINITY_DN2810_c4_g1_i1.p1  ORF type:complete len:143 (+),score=18.05 TRINITY_DN2810_c4_g1_i1:60-488(+)